MGFNSVFKGLNMAPDSELKDFYSIAVGCIRIKLLAIFDMGFKI
jgi:hypothetical protein